MLPALPAFPSPPPLLERGDRPEVDGDTVLAAALCRFETVWLRGIPGHAACVAWSAGERSGG